MRIGIMNQMWAVSECSDLDLLAQTDTDVHLAEELGFDSMMFGEHHFHRDSAFYGRVPVPELLIASLSATTSRIKLGTGVKILALDSAWRAAESALLLDLLTQGRVFFCLGQGSDGPGSRGTNAASYIGPEVTDDDSRRKLFRDRLGEYLEYLSTESEGPFGVPINPVPIRELDQRLWVAARDQPTIEMAAAKGLNFVVGQAEQAVVQRRYVDFYRAAGGDGETRGVRVVHVAESKNEAKAAMEKAVEVYFGQMSKGKYFQEAAAQGIVTNSAPSSMDEAFDKLAFCVGDPETVADKLVEYQEITGVDRFDVMFHLPALNPDAVRRSMRLFATDVMPRFATAPAASSADPR